MKHRYVVDLNVVRFAQTLTNERGQRTLNALQFLIELVARCHSIVTCVELDRKYSLIADELRVGREAQGPSIFALASTASSVTGKWLHTQRPPAVRGDEKIPDDDRVLVRLAVANRAHLVTADGRLIDHIMRSQVFQRHGLLALTIEQALEHAMAD